MKDGETYDEDKNILYKEFPKMIIDINKKEKELEEWKW